MNMSWDENATARSRLMACRCVRFATALLLIAAAIAKFLSRGEGSLISRESINSGDAVLVGVEILFGGWLASGIREFWAWATAVGVFWCFFLVSTYQAVEGSASCGCFGDFHVNPFYTATVDAGILLALCRFSPTAPATNKSGICSRIILSASVAVAAFMFLGAATGAVARLPGLSRPGDRHSTMIADPQRWIGRELPVLDRLSSRDRLAVGKCLLIFVRTECAKCQDVIRAARDRGGRCVVDGARLPIVLVQLVARSDASPLGTEAAALADNLQLSDFESSRFPTPCGVILKTGHVVRFLDSQRIGRAFSLVR